MSMVLRSDADASAYSKKMLSSNQSGLVLFGVFDTSEAKAKSNFSLTGLDDTWEVVGNPTIGLTSTEFKSQSNFIQTNIPEPAADFTICGVVRMALSREELMAGTEGAMMFGNYNSDGAGISGIAFGWSGTAGNYSFGRTFVGADGVRRMRSTIIPSTADHKKWRLVCLRFVRSTRSLSLVDLTDNTRSDQTEAEGSVPASNSSRLRIGSSYVSQVGRSFLSQLRMWDRHLSDAALAEVAAEMRHYELEHNGRTV